MDGLDLDPAPLGIARQKHPGGRFFEADMSDFHLPHRYDAITCLFSSIGYLRTLKGVGRALAWFREHLTELGVIVVEPWFAPGVLEPGRISRHMGERAGVHVERTSHTEVDGRMSRLRFEYHVAGPDGVRRATEIHELGLFTIDEMLQAFRENELQAQYGPHGVTGRGLYVARIEQPGP